MADTISINGKDIPPGRSAQINLNVAKLPTHTMIDLPVYIFRGKKNVLLTFLPAAFTPV